MGVHVVLRNWMRSFYFNVVKLLNELLAQVVCAIESERANAG